MRPLPSLPVARRPPPRRRRVAAPRRPTGTRGSGRGYTLIEVLLVVGLVAILAAIALPSYQNQVRKSRRSDAITLISQTQQAQERWRANNALYAASVTLLGLPTTSAGGYYTVAAATATGTEASSYTITATAQAAQTADTGCQVLRVASVAGTNNYLAGPSTGSLASAATDTAARRCWNR